VVDYQLGGAYPPDPAVQVIDRDSTARAIPGRYNICYVNAFQTQPDEDATWERERAGLLLRGPDGRFVDDPDWPGEHLLDTSSGHQRAALLAVLAPVLAHCASAGFQAVEADNLDSYSRSHGLLSADDNLAMARLLISSAHSQGLAIGQKNGPDLAEQSRALGFDFAVAEECQVYDECDSYTSVYGTEVIEIEYTDNGLDSFETACRARGSRISLLLRDRQVVPRGKPGYVDRRCGQA
jgi:hypothetical protein